jgi:hypothetical protein
MPVMPWWKKFGRVLTMIMAAQIKRTMATAKCMISSATIRTRRKKRTFKKLDLDFSILTPIHGKRIFEMKSHIYLTNKS